MKVDIEGNLEDGGVITVNGKTFEVTEKKSKRLFRLDGEGEWEAESGSYYFSDFEVFWVDSPYFTANKEYAEDMAEALQVWFELKDCEGVVDPFSTNDEAYYILPSLLDGTCKIFPHSWNPSDGSEKYARVSSLSPAFSSYDSCLDAIDKVGSERILKMFKTFNKV